MAIGERIRFFRILRGMTQKYLGMTVGFSEKSADVRLAQYVMSGWLSMKMAPGHPRLT